MIGRTRLSLQRLTALLGAMALAVVLVACDSDSTSPDPPPAEEDPTIAEIVAADGQFSTLLTILQAAGAVETLDDRESTFTVFAPVNAAFAPYNVDALAGDEEVLGQVIQYHVVEGAAVQSSELSDGQTITTLAGDDLLVRIIDGNVYVDGSRVTTADVMADNGVVHVIDRVMVGNQNLATVAGAVNATSTLFEVVVSVGLGEAFAGADGWTVFAPSNAAFAAIEETLGELSEEQIQEILQFHVLPEGVTNSTDLLALLGDNDGEVSVPTATGEEVVITQEGDGSISFNGGQASLDLDNLDYFASNGIIHLIDGVLLPEAYRPSQTIADIVAGDADFSTLLAAVQAAGLAEALADEEATFTVFAPNNAGFAPINVDVLLGQEAALAAVLGYHVIPDAAIESGDLEDGATVTTLAGDELTVSVDGEGNVSIGGSNVIAADIGTDNGVIHVIDRTLLANQNLANVTWFLNETAALYDVVVDVGLGNAFAEAEEWTVFAPTNAAIAVAEEEVGELEDEQIIEILQYHVIAGDERITSGDLVALLEAGEGELSVATAQGEEITFRVEEDGSISVNGGQASLDLDNLDYHASNGIIHLIDGVLLPEAYRPSQTIADVVAGDEDFSTLLAALEAADLVPALADTEATFTVFAPNNDAFGPINVGALLGQPEALASVLGFHVIPDAAIESGDLEDGATVTTLAGDELTVSVDGEGNVSIGGSSVTSADIGTDNGVIHVIDRTLLGNQNLGNVVAFVNETETLFQVVVDFGLADAFVGAENWTVFGPDNATFAEADLSGLSEEEVQAVLQYHVIAGDAPIFSAALVALLEENEGEIAVETAQGEELTIAVVDGDIVFNDGQATLNLELLDIDGSNGVLHVIQGLLLPPSFTEE